MCNHPSDAHMLQVSEKMAEPGADMDALMTKMDRLQTQIEACDGWELDRQLERAMDALRCPPGKHSPPQQALLTLPHKPSPALPQNLGSTSRLTISAHVLIDLGLCRCAWRSCGQ